MYTREQMTDNRGKFLTLGLFLEVAYADSALYTLKEVDYTYEGRFLPSLKRLYLEMEDPTEYDFATKYLCGWRHWQRIVENKVLRIHVDEWRDELEYRLRSKAVKHMLASAQEGNFQAAKWFADRGWSSRAAGRPSKAEIESEKQVQVKLGEEFGADVRRLFPNAGK